ncbi:hypothetical protein QBC37DRAFT_157918 [Rhypophila decipiens]|uniref:Uncharacterized protein n=1 Tax=Rhypophila decipiens TaxID=261697 RepID=A0AAN7B8E2_9PEZI|nr:hypothetical protein QBC37DRAFT_157918 [Rhypophila decipiens]
MATLQSLPEDILIDVLSLSQSIKDLQSLVVSCRSTHNAFRQYQKSITLSVLKAELGVGNCRRLLAILHVPQVVPEVKFSTQTDADTGPGTGDGPKLKTILQPFLDHYFSGGSFGGPSDTASLRGVLEIRRLVRRHTELYFEYTSREFLKRASPTTKNYISGIVDPLSQMERAQIQGGFLLYELYCRLFPHGPHHRGMAELSTQRRRDHFHPFIFQLDTREVEMLSCMQTYFASLATGYMEEWEDQFVNAFLSCPGALLPSKKKRQEEVHSGRDVEKQARKQGHRESMVTFNGETKGIGLECLASSRRVNISHFLALIGLEFQMKLLDAGRLGDLERGRARRHLIQDVEPGRHVLSTRTRDTTYLGEVPPKHQTCVVETRPSDLAGISVRYLRPREEHLGIVFWDNVRIWRLLNWEEDWNGAVFQKQCWKFTTFRFDLPPMKIGGIESRLPRIQAHKTLQDAKIPKTALAKLVDEFGWLRDKRRREVCRLLERT